MCDSVGARSGLRRRRKLGKKAEAFLPFKSYIPDDVGIDILSWIPAKDVLRTRCVCKNWRELTSTKDFIDLHIRRSFCMIIKDYIRQAILDRCWEPERTRAKVHKVYEPNHNGVVLSHNGLIVAYGFTLFKDSGLFLIYNPIYRDVVSITVPIKPCKPCVYGVFFHPVLKEYCTLWRVTQSHKPSRIQYKILHLETNPKSRDIKNPSNLNCRISSINPVLFDKYLYWMIEPFPYYDAFDGTFKCDIMEYDIGKEEFRVIPCPVPITVKSYNCNVNLINIDGVVSLVQVFPSQESVKIDIWKMKDNGDQLWSSSNYIISGDVYQYGVPRGIALRNAELVLQSNGRLFVCNLKQGTFRKFGQKYDHHVKFSSHVMSLVSLKNCKSNICLEEEDENNKGLGQKIQALQ